MNVNYSIATTPPQYSCATCGANGCKLWRLYQTIKPDLICTDCLEVKVERKLTPEALRRGNLEWYVAAVPCEDDIRDYWGYTSIPRRGVAWWRSLPTRHNEDSQSLACMLENDSIGGC